MKNFYLLSVVAFLISTISFAQTDGINYQAVILNPKAQELPGVDATNNILPNHEISIQFTILNNAGGIDYQEIQKTSTDAYGMINLFIGEGTQTGSNSFSEINWDGSPKNLQVDIDFNGGSNFEPLGNQKLTFIPYAYHRNINATGDLNVEGESNFNGDFILEGILTLNNDLIVTGNSTFNGDTQITGNLGVQGKTTLDSDLNVTGNTTLNSTLDVTNGSPSNLSGDLNVTGSTNLQNELNVEGQTTINNNIFVSQNAIINGNVTVDGETNLNNPLNVNNQKPTNLSGTLTVEGLTTFNNGLVIEGETIINNNLIVAGNELIQGDSEVEGDATVGQNLVVHGITSLHDVLKVDNNSATFLTGTLRVDQLTDLNNGLNVNNNSTSNLTGVLNVEGISNLNNTLNVQGVTNLESELNVNNASITNLSGELKVEGISNLNNALNVQGVTNLESELNVNNASITNLSGELKVEGISNLNNALNVKGVTNLESELNVNNASVTNLSGELNVDGITKLNNELEVTGKSTFTDSLKVNGNTILANLVVKGSNEVGGTNADHIALFENTSTSNQADGIAIRIHGNASGKLGFRNRFITFYGSANGGDYMAGRIESYDLLAGDLWESFPIPDFANLINVFDFSQVLEWTPPSLTFNGGTLPSADFYPGVLPWVVEGDPGTVDDSGCEGSNSTETEICVPGIFELNFKYGTLPSLDFNPGSLPSANFDIGNLNLNFDGFFNPTAAATAQNNITAMAAWGMRNGSPGYIPTGPWSLALAPLVIAAKQVARDQGVIYGSKGADYAEWLEKENPEEKYMFGEVVGVKGGKISRNTTDADQVMSISLAPIVLGNMPDENRKDAFEKVGFMGQVPVLTLGDVEVGDFIVASGYNDGYAKAISPENITLQDLKQVIGKAWSSSNGQKASIINVSVGLKTNEWVEILQQQDAKIKQLESQVKKINSLQKQIEHIEAKLQKLDIN